MDRFAEKDRPNLHGTKIDIRKIDLHIESI